MPGILRGEIDFETAIAKLLPHQKALISTPCRNAALVGGQGNGKSVALCLAAILHGASEPRGFSLVGRLNMPALINSTMRTFLELCPNDMGEWKESQKRFLWRNGHETVFLHLDTSDPAIAGHIKSMNLSGAFIDEATELNEKIYFLIDGRVRRKAVERHAIRLTSNPAGHDWVWRHFFNPARTEKLQALNFGIQADSFANPYLDPDAMEHWLATYPEDWKQRYIYGTFADFSDLVFKDFTEATHVWDASKPWDVFHGLNEPPFDWPVIVGIDIGSDVDHDPWAIVLIAVAPDGSLFQFNEVYGRGIKIKDIAEEVLAKLSHRRHPDVAYDYANRQAGAVELPEFGIYGQPAIKEIQPGLFKVAQYMHPDPRHTNPFTNKPGAPRFYVSNICSNTIRELLDYKYVKDRSGTNTNKPAHDSSHCPDAVRYAIHTFRPMPEKEIVPASWQNPKLDELSRMYWRDIAKQDEKRAPEKAKYPMTVSQWEAQQRVGKSRRFARPRQMAFRRHA